MFARNRARHMPKRSARTCRECVQVADRFHLLQNLIRCLKDIFSKERPDEIFIRDGQTLDIPPEKIFREKKWDEKTMERLHYDNACPEDENGNMTTQRTIITAKNINSAQKTEKKADDTGNSKNMTGNASEEHLSSQRQI